MSQYSPLSHTITLTHRAYVGEELTEGLIPEVKVPATNSQRPLHLRGRLYAAQCSCLLHHEAEESGEDGGDRPCGVPGVWMEVTDGETETGLRLEPPIRSDHHYTRRFERVVFREHQLAMVVAT